MKINNQNYAFLDIFKIIFALGIVALHTGFLLNYSYGYYVHALVFRLGVPFFFITSGYFLAKNCLVDKEKKSSIFQFIKKLFPTYFVLSLIYIALGMIRTGEFSWSITLNSIYMTILGKSPSVMWFVGALICSALIILHMKNKKNLEISIFIAIFLYLVGMSFNTYNFVLIGTRFEFLYTFLSGTFGNNSNFLFEGYLFVSMGYYFKKYGFPKFFTDNIKKYSLFIASLIFLVIEVIVVKKRIGVVVNNEYYVAHIFIIPLLLDTFLKIKQNFNTKPIRKLSTNIYYFHYMFIIFLLLINKQNQYSVLNNSNYFYLITIGVTIIFSLIYERLNIKALFNKKRRIK